MKNYFYLFLLWVTCGIVNAQDSPTVLNIYPLDGAVGVITNTPVQIEFSGPVTIAGSINDVTIRKEKGAVQVPVDMKITNITLRNSSTVCDIAYEGLFSQGTTYVVTVPGNFFTDYADPIQWRFTIRAPSPNSIYPATNQPQIGLYDPLRVTFDAPVAIGDPEKIKEIKIKKVKIGIDDSSDWGVLPAETGEETVEIEVLSAEILQEDEKVLSISHASFTKGHSYQALIPGGLVNGVTESFPSFDWFFTVEAANAVSSVPANDAQFVEINTPVSATYDDLIVKGYYFDDIRIVMVEGDEDHEIITEISKGRATIDATGTIINIAHDGFLFGKTYRAIIPGWATNGRISDRSWTFTIAAPFDFADATFPDAEDIGSIQDIIVRFENPVVAPNTILEGVIITRKSDDMKVDDVAASFNFNGDILTISHGEFEPNVTYILHIPEKLSIGLEKEYKWEFTCEPFGPRIFEPADGTKGVDMTDVTVMSVIFNLDIENTINNAIPIQIELEKSSPSATNDIDITGAAIDTKDPKKLNLSFTGTFTPGTTYRVTIPIGVVVGYNKEITWTFTTVLTSRYDYDPPRQGAVGVGIDQPLRVIFRDPVVIGAEEMSSEITIMKMKMILFDQENQQYIDIQDQEELVRDVSAKVLHADYEFQGEFFDVLSITHNPFVKGATYRVEIPAGVVNGQIVSIPSSGVPWFFTTDPPRPVSESFLPAHQAEGVALDAKVSVEFDDVIVKGYYFDDIKIALMENNQEVELVTTEASIDLTGKIITIAHEYFVPGKRYKVTIPSWAINGEVNELTWTFTTAQWVAPNMELTPAHSAVDVPLDQVLQIEYERQVATGNTIIGNVSITKVKDNEPLGGSITASFDASGKILTILHSQNFASDTEYMVTIPKTGFIMGMLEDFSWTFTTVAVPLVLQSTSPENNATNVSVGVIVSATFATDILLIDDSKISISPSSGFISFSVSGATLTINHQTFAPATRYTVTIPVKSLKDQTDDFTWSFTTAELTSAEIKPCLEAMVYPNPVYAGTEYTLQVDEDGNSTKTLELYNASGNLLQKIETANSLIRLTAPAESGIYLLRITSDKKTGTYRLVVVTP